MAYSLKITHNGTEYDASDYVRITSGIPYITKNDDFTLIADYITFDQTTAYSPVQFDIGDDIAIYSASKFIFDGYINNKYVDNANYIYTYTVNSKLDTLKDFKVDYYILSASIANYHVQKTIYGKAPTYTEERFITFNNLIQACFEAAGLSVDWTNVDDKIFSQIIVASSSMVTYSQQIPNNVVRTDIVLYPGSPTGSGVNLEDVYFWVPQLWSLNQDKICHHFDILYDDALANKRISLWDLVNTLSSVAGYNYICKAPNEFYIVNNLTLPDRNFDTEEQYTVQTEFPRYDSLTMEYKSLGHAPGSQEPFDNAMYHFFPNIRNTLGGDDFFYLSPHQDFYDDYQFARSSSFGSGVNSTSINWFNHLIPFHIITSSATFNGSPSFGNIANVLIPTVQSNDAITNNAFLAALGSKLIENYKNSVNTQLLSTNENYIYINDIDGVSEGSYDNSEIKIVTLTFNPGDYA